MPTAEIDAPDSSRPDDATMLPSRVKNGQRSLSVPSSGNISDVSRLYHVHIHVNPFGCPPV